MCSQLNGQMCNKNAEMLLQLQNGWTMKLFVHLKLIHSLQFGQENAASLSIKCISEECVDYYCSLH